MGDLRALYIMAFTSEELNDPALRVASRSAADALAKRDMTFTRNMGMVEKNTRIRFSNQRFLPTVHTPHMMQTTMSRWLKHEKISFEPRLRETFFVHETHDQQGRGQFFLFYFQIQ